MRTGESLRRSLVSVRIRDTRSIALRPITCSRLFLYIRRSASKQHRERINDYRPINQPCSSKRSPRSLGARDSIRFQNAKQPSSEEGVYRVDGPPSFIVPFLSFPPTTQIRESERNFSSCDPPPPASPPPTTTATTTTLTRR